MLDASHAIIGASIAKLVPNPYLGLPLNLILHFVFDITPHWDLRTRKTTRSKLNVIVLSLTDAFIGFSIGYLLFNQHIPLPYLFLSMFIAQLPDWLEAPYHIFDWNFPPFSSIKKLQSRFHHKLDLPWGLIIQISIVVFFVALGLTN